MHSIAARPHHLLWCLLATPAAAFAIFVAWQVVLVVVSAVVPAVVQALTASSD